MVDGGIVGVRDLAEEGGRMWWNVIFRQLCVVHDSTLFLFFFWRSSVVSFRCFLAFGNVSSHIGRGRMFRREFNVVALKCIEAP